MSKRSGQFYFRIVGLFVCLSLVWASWLLDRNPLFAIIGATAFALGLLVGDES